MVQKIEVYSGPMASGKSRELVTALRRETYIDKTPILYKPEVDTRQGAEVCPRDEVGMPAVVVENSQALLENLLTHISENPNDDIIVGIDEAQFFDDDLPGVIYYIANDLDLRVIVSGLARDFRGVPFGPMPTILAMAQEIHTIEALCTYLVDENGKKCGEPATETFRSINGEPSSFDDPVVIIGDAKQGYEARCIYHRPVKNKPDSRKYPYSK